MSRIFHKDLLAQKNIELSNDDHRHLFKSLRVQAGDEIEIGDGKGNIASAIVEFIDKKSSRVRVNSIVHHKQKTPQIILAFSILKSDSRMEWLVEKAVELNATALVPLICHRCEKNRVKLDRLSRICISAYKQSLNPYLTRLSEPINFKEFVSGNDSEASFIAVCEGNRTPISSIKTSKTSVLLIGPEGDFTEDEVNFAKEHGATPILLGEMRLRSETAAIAALSYLTLSQSS